MKITCLSDTHGNHRLLDMPGGDMVIFAGDMCAVGTDKEVEDFFDWFLELDYKHKICIAGNHDWPFYDGIVPEPKEYLRDTCVEIEGLRIYGSPWQPEFCSWAFNLPRGKALEAVWDLIPDDTDILVTHGPPAGIMDGGVGCEDLKNRVENLNLRLHVFGHMHMYSGVEGISVNASICNDENIVVNGVLEVEVSDV